MLSAIAPIVGGLLSSSAASSAAERSAQAQIEAAKIAAEAAKFKPYSVTTGFGTSYFDQDAQTATYELTPEMKAFRDFYYGQAQKVQEQLDTFDPVERARQVVAEQQALLAPERQAQDIAQRQRQLASGRIGVGVTPASLGAGMMGGAINPQAYATALARAKADAEAAQLARELGQSELDTLISRAGGLFQTGAGIEQLGAGALDLGATFGGAESTAGATMAKALLSGGLSAAETRLAGDVGQAEFIKKLSEQFGGLFADSSFDNWMKNQWSGITDFTYG